MERIATLELKERYKGQDSTQVRQEVEATKRALRQSTMKDCVGKRITQDAMKCVRTADTAQHIVEDCFH